MAELYDFLEAEEDPIPPPMTPSQARFMDVLSRVDEQAKRAKLKSTNIRYSVLWAMVWRRMGHAERVNAGWDAEEVAGCVPAADHTPLIEDNPGLTDEQSHTGSPSSPAPSPPPTCPSSPPPRPSSNIVGRGGPYSYSPPKSPTLFTPNHRHTKPFRSNVPPSPQARAMYYCRGPQLVRFLIPGCDIQGVLPSRLDRIVDEDSESIEYDERSDGELPSTDADEDMQESEEEDHEEETTTVLPYAWRDWETYKGR
ncbi:hypothetical protein EIP91_007126 [Steccherinum ochraceum]|uniref:Uncharacterized protein n=1 Tax=Steccherinum ochraceum TaxID=92696 RepID=A0A4R0RF63_9APHY|nr:hypothetical protein EIP91_007126 [Steccherinum ochraceum]